MNKDLCFQNKLNTLYSCIFHEPNSAENIELKRIDNSKEALDGWNKALHLFYNVFAKQKRFLLIVQVFSFCWSVVLIIKTTNSILLFCIYFLKHSRNLFTASFFRIDLS